MEKQLKKLARKIFRSKAWKTSSQWLRGTRDYNLTAKEYADSAAPEAQILAYFGDTRAKLYQLRQWIPVLEELNETVPTAIFLRRPSAIKAVEEMTSLPVVYRGSFDRMISYYEEHKPKLFLYVNNGRSNFQTLSYAPAVHVHINHGESDKLSMVSNQAKAYDAVFTAGPAALRRHRRALIDFDESKLISVGRPQLDLDYENELPETTLRTIMYAPTWQGENDNNNYTSIDCYGPQIIEAALATEGTRVIYKPHPRVAGARQADMKAGHRRIMELIEAANEEGGEHLVLRTGNILAMFADVDLMITDISSVGLDFLYLKADSPMLLTDRRTNRKQLTDESPVASAVPVIDADTVDTLPEMIADALANGGDKDARAEARALYFGDYGVGESRVAFIDTVQRLIAERAEKLKHLDLPAATAAEAGDDPEEDNLEGENTAGDNTAEED